MQSPPNDVLHRRFGHPGSEKTRLIEKLYGMKLNKGSCDVCLKSKNNRTSFPPSPIERQATKPLEKVSFDTAVVSTVSNEGHKYVLGFVDHQSRYLWVYLMKRKSDAYTGVAEFETAIGIPKAYRVDGEYVREDFLASCLDKRINIERTCAYSSQQNSPIECCGSTQMSKAIVT